MRQLLTGVAALTLILGGCGGSGSDQMVRSGSTPVEQKADGTLSNNPPPLTLEDVERQPAGSPERTIMQVIFWAQWGNLPAVIEGYDDRIIATLGVTPITAAFDHLRPELLTSRPRVVATRASSGGRFVSLELASTRGAPVREGFLMFRRDGVWRIVYDTLLERATEAATIAQLAPGDPTPGTAARRSGARAAQLYRSAYPSIELAPEARAGG